MKLLDKFRVKKWLEVLLAPSERAVVDVLFDTPGTFPLEHRTPDHTYVLGEIVVSDEAVERSFVREFLRPHGLDVEATPIFVDEVERLARTR